MYIKFRVFFTVIFVTALCFSQQMDEGFLYLENGKYQAAETFFEDVLKEFPTHKTARLCYGRAVGLNGNALKAKKIFTKLINDYPNDFEVKLNYGESLLWNGEFDVANAYYQRLVIEDSTSFPALLGYANTLSNLQEYEKALQFVNKALAVSPKNPNALVSKKYIYLGNAYQKQQMQQYEAAESVLKQCLSIFADDKDALLNLANLYLIVNALEKAEKTYTRLLDNSTNSTDKISAINGLALVEHLKGKEKSALKMSQVAYDSLMDKIETKVQQQTQERYIQALIWNKKFKKAQMLIDELMKNQSNENWILALQATLNVYKSNFKESLNDYEQILTNDSTSFDGNLGKANVLKALGRYDEAYAAAENTLIFYNNQKDAVNFIKELNLKFSPFYEGKASYTFDNGNNKAFSVNNSVEIPFSTRLRLLGNYTFRTTHTTGIDNQANSHAVSAGVAYQLLSNLTIKGTFGVTSASAKNNEYTQLLADVLVNIKPFKLQTLDMGYKRELQSFNAALLDREIMQNHLYANYNISSNFGVGWFTQYYYTTQNDDNSRHLLFTSLYYTMLNTPSLKVGANYQYITFQNQVPTIYFSPKRFNAGEVFINLIKDENIAKTGEWFYELTAATGLQYTENLERQNTYRFQGKVGYKFSDKGFVNIFGTRSNIASATAAGFTFTELGIRLKWFFQKN